MHVIKLILCNYLQSFFTRVTPVILVFSIQQNLSATKLPSVESRDRCITKDELIKIQKNSLEANISYFEKIKWDYLGRSNISFYDYFDFEIDWEYEAVAWEIRDDEKVIISVFEHHSIFQRLVYLSAPGKPSIVILDPVVEDYHPIMTVKNASKT
jgi:hypothetical protein